MEDEKFLQQIKEDIKLIQDNYRTNNPLLERDEYAFNYWILSKLYNVEEECIDSNITEYSDDGCDCFVFFEESKELFIIQNKYYTTTVLDPHPTLCKSRLFIQAIKYTSLKRIQEISRITNNI